MNFEQISPFIEEERENGYLLNLWQPMMKSWGVIKNSPIEKNKDFEKFISKMMEMERICIEVGDQRPIVFLRKDFLECRVEIIKKNGERWTYILHPFGYEGNWEIFDVIRI